MISKCVFDSACQFIITTQRCRVAYRVSGVFLVIVFSFAVTITQFVSARVEPRSPQGLNPAQVAASIKANAQALKAFAYQQRTQLQLKGETKKITLNQMSYDINGKPQKTLLSEQPADAQPSGGRIKRRIVAKKTGEFKTMMDEIVALVKSYTELPPDRLQTSLRQATFSIGQNDMDGSVQVVMQNVIQNGDSITIWIDRATMLYRRARNCNDLRRKSGYDHSKLLNTNERSGVHGPGNSELPEEGSHSPNR